MSLLKRFGQDAPFHLRVSLWLSDINAPYAVRWLWVVGTGIARPW